MTNDQEQPGNHHRPFCELCPWEAEPLSSYDVAWGALMDHENTEAHKTRYRRVADVAVGPAPDAVAGEDVALTEPAGAAVPAPPSRASKWPALALTGVLVAAAVLAIALGAGTMVARSLAGAADEARAPLAQTATLARSEAAPVAHDVGDGTSGEPVAPRAPVVAAAPSTGSGRAAPAATSPPAPVASTVIERPRLYGSAAFTAHIGSALELLETELPDIYADVVRDLTEIRGDRPNPYGISVDPPTGVMSVDVGHASSWLLPLWNSQRERLVHTAGAFVHEACHVERWRLGFAYTAETKRVEELACSEAAFAAEVRLGLSDVQRASMQLFVDSSRRLAAAWAEVGGAWTASGPALQVTVLDPEGARLAGVAVWITSPAATGIVAGGVADSLGEFSVEELSAGDYTVMLALGDGYTVEHDVTFASDRPCCFQLSVTTNAPGPLTPAGRAISEQNWALAALQEQARAEGALQ